MKRRLLSALLTVCMLLTMLPVTAFAADEPGAATDYVTVSSSGTSSRPGDIVIKVVDSATGNILGQSTITADTTNNTMTIALTESVKGTYDIENVSFDGNWSSTLSADSFTINNWSLYAGANNVFTVYLCPQFEKPDITGRVESANLYYRITEASLLKLLHDNGIQVDAGTTFPDVVGAVKLHFVTDYLESSEWNLDKTLSAADNLMFVKNTTVLTNIDQSQPNNIRYLEITYQQGDGEKQTKKIYSGDLRYVQVSNNTYEIESAKNPDQHIVIFYTEGNTPDTEVWYPLEVRFIQNGKTVGTAENDMPTADTYGGRTFVAWTQQHNGGLPVIYNTLVNDDMNVFPQYKLDGSDPQKIHVMNNDNLLKERVAELLGCAVEMVDWETMAVTVYGLDDTASNPDYGTAGGVDNKWHDDDYYTVHNYCTGAPGTAYENKPIPVNDISSIRVSVKQIGAYDPTSVVIKKGAFAGDFAVSLGSYSSDWLVELYINAEDAYPENPDTPDPDPEPGTDPAITDFSKDLVDSAQDVPSGITASEYDYPDPNNDNKVIIPYDGEVTLLYAITVEGKGGTTFTVTDEGATLVTVTGVDVENGTDANTFTGSIPDTGSITFYVSKTFTAENIVDGKLTNNAKIESDGGVQDGEGEAGEETPAEEESYKVYTYVEFVGSGTDGTLTESDKAYIKATYNIDADTLDGGKYLPLGTFAAPLPNPEDEVYAPESDAENGKNVYGTEIWNKVQPYLNEETFNWVKDDYKGTFDLDNIGWYQLCVSNGATTIDPQVKDSCWHLDGQIKLYDSDISVTKKLTSVQRGDETITDGLANMTLEVDDQLTWTITVTNKGNADATGLKLTDTLTANGEEILPGATVTASDGVTNMNNFSVEAEKSVEFTATYIVTTDDVGKTLKNTATVTNGDEKEEGKGETENPVGGVYTLTYDANGGNKESVPAQVTVIESGEYKLNTTKIPTHDPAAPTGSTEPVDVLFIGWTTEANKQTEILSRDDTAPTTTNEVTFTDSNITVYAAWGYDEDGNGIPDVIEKDHIVITPADITIYSGGTGYSGVVDASGNAVSKEGNGFPEPGYYITLPTDLDNQLKAAAGHTDNTPVDLSQYLTFSYNDNKGTIRKWKLERYDNSDGAASMANDKYIYRLVTTVGNQPVRLSITRADGTIQNSDEFNPTIDSLYQTFQMGIYAGGLDQNLITATVDIPGEATDQTTKDIEIGSGTLTVRGTTNASAQIALDGTAAQSGITAEAADDATFTINGSELQVKDGNEVQLLVDELVADTATTTTQDALKNKADTEIEGIDATHNFDFQYIDLVDSDNGNAWVKTDKDLTLTWEYPTGMTKDNADFAIVHYKGLDRDYDNATEEIAKTKVEAFEVEHTDTGLRFSAGASGFSPVALVYSSADGTGGDVLTTYKITYDPNGGSGSARTFEYADASSITAKDNMFTRSNHTFTGWNTAANGSGKAYKAGDVIPATGDMTLYAQWDYNGSTSSGTTRYTLTYESNGGTEYNSERYRRNTVVELDKTPIREGYTFTGWYADKDLEGDPITEIKMTSSKTVYAGWEVTFVPNWLNGDDHFAYIIGRDSGLVEPQSSITRAEVATIFFRLLKDDVRAENLTESNAFTDVAADMWYNTAISTMAKMGILEGDPDGSFRPDDNITRAEFAAIAARFSDGSYEGADIFDDIADHWARNEINLAASVGWIAGYENGSFAPQRTITRAEAMTLINRVLQRLPETEDDLLDDMTTWPDVQPEAWYYLAVQEATNSHDFDRKDDGVHETWTELTEAPDWEQYQ